MTDAPINMEDLENALHTWISESTGLTTIWDNQSAPKPNYPYCALNIISGPNPASPDWAKSWTYDPFGDPGEEIIMDAGVPCSFTLSVKARVSRPAGNNPSTSARQYILRALADLQTENRLAALREDDISFYRNEDLNANSAVVNDGFVHMASMDFLMGSVFSVRELLTFIEKVEIGMPWIVIDEDYIPVVNLEGKFVIHDYAVNFTIDAS